MKVKLISYSQPTTSKAFDNGWRTLRRCGSLLRKSIKSV